MRGCSLTVRSRTSQYRPTRDDTSRHDDDRAVEVADTSVERDDHAVVIRGGLYDDGVLASAKLLVETVSTS